MRLEFVKLQGLGNDFIFVDDFSKDIELSAEQVAWLCDRHFGIGADGVVLVRPSERAECTAYMHYINADGSLAEMCGNGVRCFAKYLVDRGYVNAGDGGFVADTLGGPKPIQFETDDRSRLTVAAVDMGAPAFSAASIPTTLEENADRGPIGAIVKEAPLASPWGSFAFTCVSMGNPHAVCFIDDWGVLPDGLFSDPEAKGLDTLKIDDIGAFFCSNEAFPEMANIEFAEAVPTGLAMRVYERGCGETLACGTGACAVAVAGSLTGRSACETDVSLLGGDLHIAWMDTGHVIMTGPAEESFTGTVLLP